MLIMNLQNLQQENGMLPMIKIAQTMVKEIKYNLQIWNKNH